MMRGRVQSHKTASLLFLSLSSSRRQTVDQARPRLVLSGHAPFAGLLICLSPSSRHLCIFFSSTRDRDFNRARAGLRERESAAPNQPLPVARIASHCR